jgi:PAS domain S-box-containing protein
VTALAEPVRSPTLRVLMVDDDRDDFLLVERMLRRVERDYHLDWVSDAKAAFDVILRQEHDVYLIDLKLGPDDGLDLIDRCREAGCDRPMILLTGHEAPMFDEQSIQRGAADYLSKNRIDAGWVDRSIRHAIARWNLQQGLESAEGRFRRAFAVAPIGIVLTDDRMGVIDSNEAFLTLVGRGEDELEGSSLVDLFDGEAGADVSRAFEASNRDDPGVARVSTRLEALDGLVRYVDVVIARFGGRPSDATHIVQTVDLTDLTLIRRRLEELLREKDEFLASVSHELRTPLTAVLGFASVLLQDGVVLSELEASGLLRTVHQQALELSNIIEDLLVAARAGTDQLHTWPPFGWRCGERSRTSWRRSCSTAPPVLRSRGMTTRS